MGDRPGRPGPSSALPSVRIERDGVAQDQHARSSPRGKLNRGVQRLRPTSRPFRTRKERQGPHTHSRKRPNEIGEACSGNLRGDGRTSAWHFKKSKTSGEDTTLAMQSGGPSTSCWLFHGVADSRPSPREAARLDLGRALASVPGEIELARRRPLPPRSPPKPLKPCQPEPNAFASINPGEPAERFAKTPVSVRDQEHTVPTTR